MISVHPRYYIIYIPGLGDHYDAGRSVALKAWKIWGVATELVPMRWYDGGSFEEKERRVLEAIRRAEDAGYLVSLIGESAGGSMAINIAAQVPHLHTLLTVSGVNDPLFPASPVTLGKSPAFKESIERLHESLPRINRRRTHVVRAWYDPIVAAQHTIIAGAQNHRLISIGHFMTIALCLTLFSGYIVALIRRGR